MSDASHYLFDHSYHSASAVLPPCCLIEFQRLSKLIQTGADRFQLIVLDCRDERLRERAITSLEEVFGATRPSTRVVLGASAVAEITEFAELEAQLRAAAEKYDIVHLVGGSRWFDRGRWESFNIRREALAHSVRASVLCWLDGEAIADMARIATDLWAWRAGVIEFSGETTSLPLDSTQRPDGSRLSLTQRARRIAELKSTLDAHPDLPADSDFDLSIELGTLLQSIGRIADAEVHFRVLAARFASDVQRHARASFELSRALIARGELDEALRLLQGAVLPAFERLGDVRSKAVTIGQIADILQARGQLDEALRIRQEGELPVFERLGDAREKAVTTGKIADILQVRGQLDEALRIRQTEELPVYEHLGDAHEKAVTMGKIADILQMRGQFDEALRIRQEEQLPVYERLGDVRAKAMTRGQIADILQARGQLDEALRIRREEELPVYERLGDVHSKAVTMGRIADILQARGQFDEALRIREEEQLPVYERLGDVRAKAMTKGKIADILLVRGQLGEALSLLKNEVLTSFEHLGDIRSKAVTMEKIADILVVRGQLDEALRIREEQLPIYERLGDVHSKAVTMGKVADILQARGQLDEAMRIYQEEELPVYERLGDVRSKAVTLGRIADILQARGQLDEALALHEQRLPTAERLGDIDSVARIRHSRAVMRLQRGNCSPQEIGEIIDDLESAFAIEQSLGQTHGIAASGNSLARALAIRGETAKALSVLDVAESAWRTLDHTAGLAEASALRASLLAQATRTSTPDTGT